MARYDPPCGGGVMEFERELLKADDGEGDGGGVGADEGVGGIEDMHDHG